MKNKKIIILISIILLLSIGGYYLYNNKISYNSSESTKGMKISTGVDENALVKEGETYKDLEKRKEQEEAFNNGKILVDGKYIDIEEYNKIDFSKRDIISLYKEGKDLYGNPLTEENKQTQKKLIDNIEKEKRENEKIINELTKASYYKNYDNYTKTFKEYGFTIKNGIINFEKDFIDTKSLEIINNIISLDKQYVLNKIQNDKVGEINSRPYELDLQIALLAYEYNNGNINVNYSKYSSVKKGSDLEKTLVSRYILNIVKDLAIKNKNEQVKIILETGEKLISNQKKLIQLEETFLKNIETISKKFEESQDTNNPMRPEQRDSQIKIIEEKLKSDTETLNNEIQKIYTENPYLYNMSDALSNIINNNKTLKEFVENFYKDERGNENYINIVEGNFLFNLNISDRDIYEAISRKNIYVKNNNILDLTRSSYIKDIMLFYSEESIKNIKENEKIIGINKTPQILNSGQYINDNYIFYIDKNYVIVGVFDNKTTVIANDNILKQYLNKNLFEVGLLK